MSTSYDEMYAAGKADALAGIGAYLEWADALDNAMQAELNSLPQDMAGEEFAAWEQSHFDRYIAPLMSTLHELGSAFNEVAELGSGEPLHRYVAELGKRTEALRALRQPTPADR